MNLLTVLYGIVSQMGVRRPNHGGEPASEDSEGLTIENPEEWHPEDLLVGSGACESIAPDDREGPSMPKLPEVVEHDGEIIIFGGHGTDWIRADPKDVIDWGELA